MDWARLYILRRSIVKRGVAIIQCSNHTMSKYDACAICINVGVVFIRRSHAIWCLTAQDQQRLCVDV